MEDGREPTLDRGELKEELDAALTRGAGPKVARFALACLSGAIPIAGGVIGAAGGAWSEAEQDQFNKICAAWLRLQEDEIKEIGQTLFEVFARIDQADEKVRARLKSKEYLALLKKCFRDWSAAESEEKRKMIRNLLANAAGAEKLCSDDVLRLFVEWIDRYTEGHFRVVRAIYNNSGITRQEIWYQIHGGTVREDSAEADLFKLFMHDLSVGHVIRQHREKDYHGNFLKAKRTKSTGPSNPYVKSAFDDDKQYELTELGQWFVHYTMNELVPRLTNATPNFVDSTATSH
jgi:hypothetical protein